MRIAPKLKLDKPIEGLDDEVARILEAEHHEHRWPRPLCPLCPGGVRRYREVVPPRERSPEQRIPWQAKTWAWFEGVRSRPGEWVTVERRETSAAARSMAKRWKSRGVAGLSIRVRGCEIEARWEG